MVIGCYKFPPVTTCTYKLFQKQALDIFDINSLKLELHGNTKKLIFFPNLFKWKIDKCINYVLSNMT